jgi:uncharacterized repeat protein (TIGR03803 family)
MQTSAFIRSVLAIAACAACVAAGAAPPTVYTEMLSFDGSNGSNPNSRLTLAPDGNFYGTMPDVFNRGEVFRMTPAGVVTVLHVFTGSPDGQEPDAPVTLGPDGSIWGTTRWGGTSDRGTVWELTKDGAFKIVHSFDEFSASPVSPLLLARDGNFYGTTPYAGAAGYGSVYRISPAGDYAVLASFYQDHLHGVEPMAGLVQAADGSFWGTLSTGGPLTTYCGLGCGGVFRLAPSGKLTLMEPFEGSNGTSPVAPLTIGRDGMLYGVTPYCGHPATCQGTAFRLSKSGQMTVLHTFTSTDVAGSLPSGGLLQDSDGYFYGEAFASPASVLGHSGTVYRMNRAGSTTLMHDFAVDRSQAYAPQGGLAEDKATGTLYGVAQGGIGNNGVTFKLSRAASSPDAGQ